MGANFLAPQFWDSHSVAELGKCGKLLFAAMITGPQLSKVPGLYRATATTFYHQMLPWEPPEVEDAFKTILAAGMAIYDPVGRLVRIPNVGKYHLPQNAKQIMSWRTNWADLPNVPLKFEHLHSLQELAYRSETGPDAFERYFSGIVQGKPETYPLKRERYRKPIDILSEPAAPAQRERNDLSLPEKRDLDQDHDLDHDLDQPSRNHSDMVKKGIGRVSNGTGTVPVGYREGFRNGTVTQEGESNESGRVPRRTESSPRGGDRSGVQSAAAPAGQPGGVPEGHRPKGRSAEVVTLHSPGASKARRKLE